MSKMVRIVIMGIILTVLLTLAATGAVFADDADSRGLGPAPNSGDCIPDGPGWEDEGIEIPNGPKGYAV